MFSPLCLLPFYFNATGVNILNIFYLDRDPVKCAQMHCDKHVVKMILEYAQLLSTAHHIVDGDPNIECYKATHKNPPSAVWARENIDNYKWLWRLLVGVCKEYTKRYGKIHKTERVHITNNLQQTPSKLGEGTFTDPPQCMPDTCKDYDSVVGYRNYYVKEKSYMAKWKNTSVPNWYLIGMAIAND